jgi:hypothetical protein
MKTQQSIINTHLSEPPRAITERSWATKGADNAGVVILLHKNTP